MVQEMEVSIHDHQTQEAITTSSLLGMQLSHLETRQGQAGIILRLLGVRSLQEHSLPERSLLELNHLAIHNHLEVQARVEGHQVGRTVLRQDQAEAEVVGQAEVLEVLALDQKE